MNKAFSKYFEFLQIAEKLKYIERFKGHPGWKDYPQQERYESVADHTWRMALMLILFAHKVPKLNMERALKMIIVHDLAEVYAGDEPATGKDGVKGRTNKEIKNKKLNETKALSNLVKILPDINADEIKSLWEEFENYLTLEAKVVKALDKLEGKMVAVNYSKGGMYKEHYEFSRQYGTDLKDIPEFLQDFIEEIGKEMDKHYIEFKK